LAELLLRERRTEIITGSAARKARRRLHNDIQPPSRLANTGPTGPVSPSSAVNSFDTELGQHHGVRRGVALSRILTV
jgi:hypothetical protein